MSTRVQRSVLCLRDDSGAVAAIVAVLAVALLSLSALVIDMGYMYDVRRELQAVAESAALAGCQELIATGDAGLADAEARAYAAANAVEGPVDALEVESVDVDVAEGSVRVIVAQESPAFFSQLFGPATNRVRAAAKAQKWALTGGRYLVPWAIPILRNIDRVEVSVVDDKGAVLNSTNLSQSSDLLYTGAVSAPGTAGGYDVLLRIYNTYGIVEYMYDSANNKETPIGRINVLDAAGFLSDVDLSDDFITAGSGTLPVLSVVTKAVEPNVYLLIGGTKRTMTSPDGTHWTYQIQPGDIDSSEDLLRTYPIDVSQKKNGDGSVEAYLHVRRSSHPVADCDIDPLVAAAGSSVSVEILLNELYPPSAVPGQEYVLRVAAEDAFVGNSCELNYNTIQHTASCPPDPVVPKPGNNYADWTAYGYEGGVHVGDIIDTSPGGSGINTYKALNDRRALLPPGEPMVVTVPVVEKYEQKDGGAYEVIVEGFASFEITYYGKDGLVIGEFIQYIANPSSYGSGSGGGSTAPYAARLVNP